MDQAPFITFSSDYGPFDEFVGVCHAVIARIAPQARVVDLAHGVRGVRAASATLARSVPFAPPGVHLAIVDPTVGTDRRGVLLVCASGSMLVGPDNGLLISAANVLGGVVRGFELTEPRYRLVPTSATFHGRDVFAPAAAHLARGVAPEAFGPEVGWSELVRLPPARIEVSEGRLDAEVLRTDWYGNIQLAATSEDLRGAKLTERVSVNGKKAVLGRTFADAPAGELVVLVDSIGFVAVCVNGGSASQLLGACEAVEIRSD